MSVVVYKYGVHYKWAKNLPELVLDQLFLANQVRNRLVESERAYDEAKAALWSTHPEIEKLESQIEVLDENITAWGEELKGLKIAQKTKLPKGDQADQLRAMLKEAKAEIKKTRASRREEISKAYAAGLKEDLSAVAQVKFDAERVTYEEFVQGKGLYHNTHHELLGAHKTAVKNIARIRAKGEPAELGFKRFDGTGLVSVGLKKGAPKGEGYANKRTCEELALDPGPHSGTCMIPFPKREDWENMTTAERRRAGRVVAKLRVKAGAKTDSVIEIPIQIHRLPPEGAEIKTAKLVVRRVGSRRFATLNLSVTIPDPQPVDDKSTVDLEFGFKKTEAGNIKVMSFLSKDPFSIWKDVRGNPRYPLLNQCLTVAPNLCTGHLEIPARWAYEIERASKIKSDSDLLFDQAKARLASWLEEHGPVEHPSRTDKEGNPQTVTSAKVMQWKSHGKLASFTSAMIKDGESSTDMSDLLDDLSDWARQDKRLTYSERGLSGRVYGRRADLYQQVAALLADNYGTISLLEDRSEEEEIKRISNDQALPEEVKNKINRQRNLAAPSELKSKIQIAASQRGVSVNKG